MEGIEDQGRVRQTLAYLSDKGSRHVQRDQLDVLSSFVAKSVQKAVEGVAGLALAAPDDLATLVVSDEGEVLVVLAVADLIQTDAIQTAKA